MGADTIFNNGKPMARMSACLDAKYFFLELQQRWNPFGLLCGITGQTSFASAFTTLKNRLELDIKPNIDTHQRLLKHIA
jgi:hypothetical protein